MKIKIVILFAIVILLGGCATMNKYDYKISDIKRLEKEAIKVDKMINVSARKYYEVYMSLGEAYYQYNYFDKSLAALKKGLRVTIYGLTPVAF